MHRHREKGITLIELSFVLAIIAILAGIGVIVHGAYYGNAQDAVTKGDLRNAYSAAMVYFLDFPEGKITQSDLEKYGFKASPHVNLKIIYGERENLLLIAYYNAPGTQGYMTYSRETNQPGTDSRVWLASIQGWGGASDQGPSQPVPLLLTGPSKGEVRAVQADILMAGNQIALADLQLAYGAAQAFFRDHPQGTISKDSLFAYGYSPDENVDLTVNSGGSSDFSLASHFSIPGSDNFTADSKGRIMISSARR